jgi:glycosyltransferase involved in cell wall biosynthesis
VRLGLRALRKLARTADHIRVAGFRFTPNGAPSYYLSRPHIRGILKTAQDIRADVYLANDWHMLPVAMAVAQRYGAIFGYDTHEYALEEYSHRFAWRLMHRPLVRAVEGVGLATASVRTCVSSGIGDDIAKAYGLAIPPVEIRNVPDRQDIGFRPTNPSSISVLFHGILAPNRGIEACLHSVPLWRPEYSLTLRGPGDGSYLQTMRSVIAKLGIASRVTIAPPVPMLDLVQSASKADIGVVTLPASSKHNLYALPNKLFEYIQAGLALVVSDLPDMERLVHKYGVGVTTDGLSAEAIAAAINSFDATGIDQLKRASLLAAKELNWQTEQQLFVGLYREALNAERQKLSPASPERDR